MQRCVRVSLGQTKRAVSLLASLCAVLVLPSLTGSGCAAQNKSLSTAEMDDTARRIYYEGVEELIDGNFVQATKLFNQVARSPRYVSYAALAKLRIGDALYIQDRYAEATEVYRAYMSQFKSDPNAPYGRFRIAASYYKRIPSEWFASPAAYEMDQTLTRQAEAELKGFLSMFPTSRFATEARQMLNDVRRMLFESELFAADFYENKKRWRAVAWRLDKAVDTYPEFGLNDALVWRMAKAYAAADEQADAARAYGLYLKNFPDGEHQAEAKAGLDAIRDALDKSTKDSDS